MCFIIFMCEAHEAKENDMRPYVLMFMVVCPGLTIDGDDSYRTNESDNSPTYCLFHHTQINTKKTKHCISFPNLIRNV